MAYPQTYLVLGSQRSGSTLLVESLRATGVAGEPQEFFQYLRSTSKAPQPRQWFEGVTDETILARLAKLEAGTPDARTGEQWRADLLRYGRTPNGVWGGKLMWNQTPLVIDRAADLPDRSGTDLRSALRDVLGDDVLFVHIARRDVVPQAVSFWRAVQTQTWRGQADPVIDGRAEYHAGGIAHFVTILRNQEANWNKWFTDESIEPIEVEYRDLVANTTNVVGQILKELGQDPTLAPAPPLERQAGKRSLEWIERYQADTAREGLPT